MGTHEAGSSKVYRVGIDVGTNSVGMAAVEVDPDGIPIGILSAVSHLHDGGVLEAKTATTRLAAAGVARRMRRLRRKRSKRLAALEEFFARKGWRADEVDADESCDPYAAWRARAQLATQRVDDPHEFGALMVRALRHMARHRGWRNPYIDHKVFYEPGEHSEQFEGFHARVEEAAGRAMASPTVAGLAVAAVETEQVPGRAPRALRMGRTANRRDEKPFSYLGGKLFQVDNANEIHAYARTQGWGVALLREVIDAVFVAESPRGSWVSKIGKDPLDGRPRAPKATDAFQRFRIVSVLANVRVREGGRVRALTNAERRKAFDYLLGLKPNSDPTWADVASELGLARGALSGVAATDDEGVERMPLRPPVHVADSEVRSVKAVLKDLKAWWAEADGEERDALVVLLTDGVRDESTRGGAAASALLEDLPEEALTALDSVGLPAGRAAYSIESLRALTARMLDTEDDLHAARKAVFGVSDDWTPPSDPIGAPVGNPAVDRVTKIVARWLRAAEAAWGAPSAVTIEHVRDAFMSESAVRERDREMRKRFDAAERERQQLKSDGHDRVRNSDVRRYQAITRQKGQCAYCGDTITMHTAEMDHIVPRKGAGSTNTRTNLLAVCIPCNRSKSSLPFAVWADRSPRPGVSVDEAITRTQHWTKDAGFTPRSWRVFLAEVRERLKRPDEDSEIDARSMESVAWMANELRERIDAHFRARTETGRGGTSRDATTNVYVYQGAVTAGARQAAGIEGRIPFLGGGGKTRLDRRHHAVDAAVTALMDVSVARTLAERNSMRSAQFFAPDPARDWRDHAGSSPAAQERFSRWKRDMHSLADLLSDAFDRDTVVVTENRRLRLGSGKVHDDTLHPMQRRRVGDAFSRDEIDAAATPALWTALTRDPEFDEGDGLPANPRRGLRLRGTHLGADDVIDFFDKPRAALAVRGGWAQVGNSIHHVRIYRWEERGKVKYGMLRVFASDLLRHRNDDLFAVDPNPNWISMRTAHPSIGRAGVSDKEYLGWLVPGDEIVVKMHGFSSGGIQELRDTVGVPEAMRWRVTGAEDALRLTFKPLVLAGEGIEKWSSIVRPDDAKKAAVSALIAGKGWRISVSKLFAIGEPTVIRRDGLGRVRDRSTAGLPTSWRAV